MIKLPIDLHLFSLTLLLFYDKEKFSVISVLLRETAEFRYYSLVALTAFHECVFQYKSPGHKSHNNLLF